MKVNIDFAEYVAVIEFEPFLGEDITKYWGIGVHKNCAVTEGDVCDGYT